jgi:cytochrome c
VPPNGFLTEILEGLIWRATPAMFAKASKNRVPASAAFTALVMILLFVGFCLFLVVVRQTIPTVDEYRREQRLKILSDLNVENDNILSEYRWIDRSKGRVGIPIDRAMALVLIDLQSNKPHPLGPVVTPAPANNPSSKRDTVKQSEGQRPNGFRTGPSTSSGDPRAGEVIFKQCAACHSLDKDTNKQGPTLAGLFGRHAGSVEDFNYSQANKNSGIVWDEAILRKYLANPQSVVPGTKMTFMGLHDPQQIEDTIAYLKEATRTK